MTIKLSREVENELVVKIAEGIDNTVPKFDMFTPTDAEWATPLVSLLTEDAKMKLEKCCGEHGMRSFIYHEMIDIFHDAELGVKLTPGSPINRLIQFSRPIEVAKRIVAKLKSLPIRYRATVALPSCFSQHILGKVEPTTQLTPEIMLVMGGALPSPLPVHAETDRRDRYMFLDYKADKTSRYIDENLFYLSMVTLGYATQSSSTIMGRGVEDSIKAFLGAAIASDLVEFGWDIETSWKPFIMMHNESGDRKLLATEKLEQELLDNEMSISTRYFAEKHQSNIASAFNRYLKDISAIYRPDQDCRKLFTACIWYYRASVSRRPLDKLLEATIAIEVMLGDRMASEGVGLSNLLGNRCAFLLGKSSDQRRRIMELFKRIYELRSNIVHEGRHSLQTGDQKTVSDAVTLCGSIIKKELSIRGAAEKA